MPDYDFLMKNKTSIWGQKHVSKTFSDLGIKLTQNGKLANPLKLLYLKHLTQGLELIPRLFLWIQLPSLPFPFYLQVNFHVIEVSKSFYGRFFTINNDFVKHSDYSE